VKIDRGRIEFDQASFWPRPDNPVLRQLSFTAEPGEVTAFVGPSGGGAIDARAVRASAVEWGSQPLSRGFSCIFGRNVLC
jgi:ABC-type protease/lipase transport system fused ATPase/permease subunit